MAKQKSSTKKPSQPLQPESSAAAKQLATAHKTTTGTKQPEAGPAAGHPDTAADLAAAEAKRQGLVKDLKQVEKQIFDLETRYLETSNPHGCAIRGYEGLLTQSSAHPRRQYARQEDRLFSSSSISGAHF